MQGYGYIHSLALFRWEHLLCRMGDAAAHAALVDCVHTQGGTPMNLLQTYQAEQAIQHTHANIARELHERQQLMLALAPRSNARPRFHLVHWLTNLAFVARFMRISRYGAIGR